jgi:catechol 2,3-dioxygenase-like lactoylglutathione lyase family enzyme
VAAPAAAADGHGFKAVTVNHISYQVADYAKTRDFYADLLGMKVLADTGSQCNLAFGDSFLLPRTPRARPGDKGGEPQGPPQATPRVDHMAYTIENWNKEKVEAELQRRGYKPREQGQKGQGGGGRLKPMEYRPDTENSFHILDPDGFDLQISGKDMHA